MDEETDDIESDNITALQLAIQEREELLVSAVDEFNMTSSLLQLLNVPGQLNQAAAVRKKPNNLYAKIEKHAELMVLMQTRSMLRLEIAKHREFLERTRQDVKPQ